MERNKYLSSNRAITLVALIITIIVMLILVAVTIRVVVNSDLIGQAEEAGELYENAYKEESIGKIKINGKEYNNINEYFATNYGEEINFQIEIMGEWKTFTVREGMTWKDWVNSEYNTIQAFIQDNMVHLLDPSDAWVMTNGSSYFPLSTDEIPEGGRYTMGIPENANEISFEIEIKGTWTTFTAKRGMTWGSWINSGYNSIQAFIQDNMVHLSDPSNAWVMTNGSSYFPLSTDEIPEGGRYTMGGPENANEISFQIELKGTWTTFTAKRGMTWESWVNSGYNSIQAYIQDNMVHLVDPAEAWVRNYESPYNFPLSTDEIPEGGQYIMGIPEEYM